MRSYRLNQFMEYPNFAFKLAMIQPFTWSGAVTHLERNKWKRVGMKVWFCFGAVNLIYQTIGMLICLVAPQLTHFSSSNNVAADGDTDISDGNNDVTVVAQIAETGGIMGLVLVSACKMLIMFRHEKRISNLLEEFEELLSQEQQQLGSPPLHRVHHFAHASQCLMKRITIFFMFAFCFYNFLPIMEIVYEYLSPDMEIKFRHQSNTWYPWQSRNNAKSWPSFVAAYLCQMQSSLTGVAFIMAGEFMLCFFITQMQLHLDNLTNGLRALDASSAGANAQLRQLIVYHIKLLRYSKEINAIFNISFLVNFVTSSIAICLMGFSMLMESVANTSKYLVGLMTMLVFNFFICYNGSEFTAASDELLPAAFYNNWYEGNISYQRIIMIFILRATKSNVLTAYKFTIVSMPTFMAILKFSYQLFTFIRTMG